MDISARNTYCKPQASSLGQDITYAAIVGTGVRAGGGNVIVVVSVPDAVVIV
jgi:hypothetical protein